MPDYTGMKPMSLSGLGQMPPGASQFYGQGAAPKPMLQAGLGMPQGQPQAPQLAPGVTRQMPPGGMAGGFSGPAPGQGPGPALQPGLMRGPGPGGPMAQGVAPGQRQPIADILRQMWARRQAPGPQGGGRAY